MTTTDVEQKTIHSNLTSSSTGNFYFAFGSNLSAFQMRLRLPNQESSAQPVALAYLPAHTWIICARGYANVVALPESNSQTNANVVWGIVYNMSPEAEAMLDRYEGCDELHNPKPELNPDPETQSQRPYLQGNWDYNKHYLPITVTKWFKPPQDYGIETTKSNDSLTITPDTMIRTLVYVDEFRTQPGKINAEYIGRMNRAIDEAIKLGLPEDWVDETMREWIPKGIYVDDEGYVGTDKGWVEAEATETLDQVKERQIKAVRERTKQPVR